MNQRTLEVVLYAFLSLKWLEGSQPPRRDKPSIKYRCSPLDWRHPLSLLNLVMKDYVSTSTNYYKILSTEEFILALGLALYGIVQPAPFYFSSWINLQIWWWLTSEMQHSLLSFCWLQSLFWVSDICLADPWIPEPVSWCLQFTWGSCLEWRFKGYLLSTGKSSKHVLRCSSCTRLLSFFLLCNSLFVLIPWFCLGWYLVIMNLASYSGDCFVC